MWTFAYNCRCLQAEFIQYLSHVLHGLLKAARQIPDIQVLELGDDNEG